MPGTPEPARMGSVLAFDFGTRRIGIAVGEPDLGIAHPLPAIDEERTVPRFAAIEALLAQWKPELCVVGLPLTLAGDEQERSRLARRFAARLRGRAHLPVHFVDERLTSVTAAERLRSAGASSRVAAEHNDSAAACEILTAWFASVRTPEAG